MIESGDLQLSALTGLCAGKSCFQAESVASRIKAINRKSVVNRNIRQHRVNIFRLERRLEKAGIFPVGVDEEQVA